MTHVCYSLPEAADKLKLTETVLVRLSQYFKMPRVAYEESGYLSFKGDLVFTEPDLQFFNRVKERLLLGDTLEMVRRHLDSLSTLGEKVPGESQDVGTSVNRAVGAEALLPVAPLREIQDRQPYEKAAEASFERYKSKHRPGLGRVFESLLKEVGGTTASPQAVGGLASPAPLSGGQSPQAGLGGEKAPQKKALFSTFLPPETMDRSGGATTMASVSRSLTRQTPPPADTFLLESPPGSGNTLDATWEQLVKQAVQQPRVLNSHLKTAAALLRERSLGPASSHQDEVV